MSNRSALIRMLCFALVILLGRSAHATILTIGTGTTSTNTNPLNTCFNYNYSQSIYLASELVSAGASAGTPGYIYSIQFQQTTATTPDSWKDWVIYMGNVSTGSFATDTSWIPLSSMSTVFSGTVTPSGTGWYTITLTTPFFWDGYSNVVVAVDENTPGFLCTSSWQITMTSGTAYRSLAYYGDVTDPSPASPPTAITRGLFYPNIKLDYSAAVACAGAPAGGNTSASAAGVCVGSNVTLTITGGTAATGLTYAWQSSASAAGPWTAIPGATAAALTFVPPACDSSYYRRATTCTATGAVSYATPAQVITTCGLVPPYTEDFESITKRDDLPACMHATNPGSYVLSYLDATGSYNQQNHTPGGSKYVSFRYGADDYLFTPALNLTAGRTYELTFWYVTDGYPGWTTLAAKLGNSPTAAGMGTTLASIPAPANALYQQFTTTFIAASSGIQYIGIYCKASTAPWYLTVDDINLRELPPCAATPVAGTPLANPARICTSGAPTLSLSGTSAVTGLSYRWESSMTGAPGTFAPIPGGTTATFTAPSISTATYYHAVVKCMLTGDSSVSAPLLVQAGTYDPPYFEGFENITTPNQLPPCMLATSVAPYLYTYLTATGSYNQTNHTPGGYRFASFRYGSNDYLFTPGINLISGRTYEFSFWYITDGSAGWNTLSAKYGTAQTVAAMTTALGAPVATPSNTTYKQYKVRFVASSSGVQYFGIYCNATTAPWYLSIDDISVQEIPVCAGKPTPGVPLANPAKICGIGTTLLDLPGLSPSLGITYKWEDSVAGGSWGTGPGRPSFGGFSLPFTTGTVTTTTYFRCKVICGSTGDTGISATLKVAAGVLSTPYFESFEFLTTANQLPECMSATSIAPNVYTALAPLGTYNRFNHTPGGSKYAYFRYGSDDYLFTPAINVVAGYHYIFTFWYITDGSAGWNTLRANYGLSPTAAAMTGTLKSITAPANTVYAQYADTFLATSTGPIYMGIYVKGNSSPYYLSVDDIGLQPVPCTGTPDAGKILSTIASGTSVCMETRVTLVDSGASTAMVPGISYSWQRSAIGSGIWSDIAYATDTVYANDGLAGWDYRFETSCASSGMKAYSAPFRLGALPPHPPVSISPVDSLIKFCYGDTVFLSATAYSGGVYRWYRNNVLIPGISSDTLGTLEPGTYNVQVTSAVSSCTAGSGPAVLRPQDPGYAISLLAPSDTSICSGDSVILKSFYTVSMVSLQWRKNNVDIPGATDPYYTVTSSGDYRIVADNGAHGCKAVSQRIDITVRPVPVAFIETPASGLVACASIGVPLEAMSGPDYYYQWFRNGSPVYGWVDSSVLAKDDGVYTVRIRNNSSCVAYSDGVTVKIFPSPSPVIVSSGLVLGVSATFSSYQWYRGGVLMPGRVSDTLELSSNGDYTVVVTDVNGCPGESAVFTVSRPDLGIGTLSSTSPEIQLYPNPAMDKVFIKAPVPVRVSVKDITGRLLTEEDQPAFINMQSYADGLYLFTITDAAQRVLKQEKISKSTSR